MSLREFGSKEDDLRLPDESQERIQDRLERIEFQLEKRVKGLGNQAIGVSITIGAIILILVFVLLHAWGKL
jgi:hypothetical protein